MHSSQVTLQRMRAFLIVLALATLAGCRHAPPRADPVGESESSSPEAAVSRVVQALNGRDCPSALAIADQALRAQPRGDSQTVYRASRMAGLVGVMSAVTSVTAPFEGTVLHVGTVWPDLWYAKAWCLVE